MAERLVHRTTLVTGAGSGIGQATALLFAQEGGQVVVADQDADAGQDTVQRIHDVGGTAIFVPTDVSSPHAVAALVQRALATFGRLDCAVNNAGVSGVEASTAECSEENWDRVLATNLKGVWLCMKYEIPAMLEQGRGAIVNTSSISGLIGLAGWPAYCASKHGILGLTKVAALEYCRRGIRINAVCPGVIHTPMLEGSFRDNPQARDALAASEPIGRMGQPEEVAAAIVWLCSDAASFMVGSCVSIDGGFVAQ